MKKLKIRPCKKSDQKAYIKLNREFMNYEIGDNIFWDQVKNSTEKTFEKVFQEAMDSPDLITIWILEVEGEMIGFVNLLTIYSIWSYGKALIIDDIYIREEQRGRGIGKEVMDAVVQYAKEKEYKRIQFQAEKNNEKAQAFYRKLGFEGTDMLFHAKYL